MKLDATDLRYISNDEFRVLTATEMGSKNHEIVPSALIAQISGLRSGGVNKHLGQLAKRNLIAKVQNAKYDGYRLTYGGYDYLAMRTFAKRDTVYSVGNQIGVGKESDIYVVADSAGKEMVLKIHRLGRISFRAIKSKRDYLGKRKSASWMYMSRLSAQKEFAFMKVLHEHGFPVPTPIDQARHCIVMSMIDSFPLRQVDEVPSVGGLYSDLMDLIVRLARSGLIHGDFNEFNILIHRVTGQPVLIDFPQMVSVKHENAQYYFDRDVECIRRFFRKRFRYESSRYPTFAATLGLGADGPALDVEVAASGFGHKEQKALEDYMAVVKEEEEEEESEEESEEEGSEEGSDGEEEDSASAPAAQPSASSPSHSPAPPDLSTLSLRASSRSPSPTHPSSHPDDSSDPESDPDSDPDSLAPSHAPSRAPRAAAAAEGADDLKARVAQDLAKRAHKQARKHHGRKGANAVGRAKGSKRKQDGRVRLAEEW